VVHEQVVIERVGMIEVGDVTIVERKVGDVSVVRVLLNKNYFAGTDRFKNPIRNSCFPRSRAPTNADD
jgi:hypothetical protein